MKVTVHLFTQSQPMKFRKVRNAYQKGDLYCIALKSGEVHKFPLCHIFRITES